MGCLSSKDALLQVDDSVQVGLKRAKKRTNGVDTYSGYVPPTSHPLIKLKSENSSSRAGGDGTTEETTDKSSESVL